MNNHRPLPRRPAAHGNNDRKIRAGTSRVIVLIRQFMAAKGLQIYDIASDLRCTEGNVVAVISMRGNFPISRAEAWSLALRLDGQEREEFLDAVALSALNARGMAVIDRLRGVNA